MKKFATLMLVMGAVALTAACSSIPECQNQDLDQCNRGHAYSEERTAWGKKEDPKPVQAPVVVQEKIVVEEVVVEPEPAPAPAPVDEQIIQQAPEPSLTK